MRSCGVLLPVFSLPSKYGIGCFSSDAKSFIDRLAAAGQSCWQILPLSPTGPSNSPYTPRSCMAGNFLYIDPETLHEKGLITKKELSRFSSVYADFHEVSGLSEDCVDYSSLRMAKEELCMKAFRRFDKLDPEHPLKVQFREYEKNNKKWLRDYALFMVFSAMFTDLAWTEWPEKIRRRDPDTIKKYRKKLKVGIAFYEWEQYEFFTQWREIRNYAHSKGILIIGDMSIYADLESADCWAHPEFFQMTKDGRLINVAGVPPDAFAEDGQKWGNPLYDWDRLKEDGYSWWITRIEQNYKLYDIVRLDHTLGYGSYFSIPAEKSAREGTWIKGPGMDFFNFVKETVGDRFIAEDLGTLSPEVWQMIEDTGMPRMKVMQFAFDSDESNPFLTDNFGSNNVVYTGTHDNDTSRGWYESIPDYKQNFFKWYVKTRVGDADADRITEESAAWKMIRLAMHSKADMCIIPMQDYLNLGTEARINVPGKPSGNWRWRMKGGAFTDELCTRMAELAVEFNRKNGGRHEA